MTDALEQVEATEPDWVDTAFRHPDDPPLPFAPELGSSAQKQVELDPDQADAIMRLLEWYVNGDAGPFKIAGYAGVGKSTIVYQAIEALGLPFSRVGFVTYTGKAALVLNQKGIPGYTIHRLIYVPRVHAVKDAETGVVKSKVTGFDLRSREELDGLLDLIVVDEVSMVSDKILNDLMSFGIRMLVLGDPAQLPPVRDKPNKLLEVPHVFLTRIHRQAADNPILWASMMIRNGEPLPYGTYGENLWVVRRSEALINYALMVDQVVCCTHRTRVAMNQQMRRALGFAQHGDLPQQGEKLICLKNNWDEIADGMPLVNGMMVRPVRSIEPEHINRRKRTFRMTAHIEGEPDAKFFALPVNLDYFTPVPGEKPTTEADCCHFDFGNALTIHKAQGSEWKRGLVIGDVFGDWLNQRQLLYTGLTRFSEFCVLAL